MRVAQVCPYDWDTPGGVQVHVENLTRALRDRGEEVLVVTTGTAGLGGGVVRVGSATRVPFNKKVAPIALSPAAGRGTLAALEEFAPDVVHLHEPTVPVTCLTALRSWRGPMVATFHSWSSRSRLYGTGRPLYAGSVARLGARIAVSRAARTYHSQALGLPEQSFQIIPNGVDVAHFASGKRRQNAPTVLFVGRLEPPKGLEQAVRAFLKAKKSVADLRLVVVGEGSERERCQGLIPEAMRSDVSFDGAVGQASLPDWYSSATVYTSPATGSESFGIVLLEAMAAGCPVIASDIDGYREVVIDGLNGVLVPSGDVAALADQLVLLLGDDMLRARLADAGRTRANQFDWPSVARSIQDVYRGVAEVFQQGD